MSMDTNIIVLEGINLYISIAIVLFFAISNFVALLSSLALESKNEELQLRLEVEQKKNERLNRDNLSLKLKHGGLEPHEKVI